jgi:hypothetical protein
MGGGYVSLIPRTEIARIAPEIAPPAPVIESDDLRVGVGIFDPVSSSAPKRNFRRGFWQHAGAMQQSKLQEMIADLARKHADQLAHEIADALHGVTLGELLSLTGAPGPKASVPAAAKKGRPPAAVSATTAPRATKPWPTPKPKGPSSAEIAMQALAVLQQQAGEILSEELRKRLGGPSKNVYHFAMGKLVKQGAAVRSGEKRSTAYRLAPKAEPQVESDASADTE